MLRFMKLQSHWSPEEALSMLTLLDELREAIWQAYGDEITEYCRLQQIESAGECSVFPQDDSDIIPF